MASTPRESYLSRRGRFLPLFSARIVVARPGAGRRGTPPCKVGRASRARLPGILPGSDGINDTRLVPLAPRCVRVSLLGRIVVARPGAGRRGTPPCIGRDVQPTEHRTGRPTHKWVARPARGSPASCRGAMASTPRESYLSRCGRFLPLFSAKIVVTCPEQGGAGRRPAKWVARPARGSPASCRGAMASTPRESYLSRCGRFASLFSAKIVVTCPEQGGAGRRPASDGTSNPLSIGRDVQPTSGSRVPREAPRHPAGERWHQRHANRTSRAAVGSCLSSRRGSS